MFTSSGGCLCTNKLGWESLCDTNNGENIAAERDGTIFWREERWSSLFPDVFPGCSFAVRQFCQSDWRSRLETQIRRWRRGEPWNTHSLSLCPLHVRDNTVSVLRGHVQVKEGKLYASLNLFCGHFCLVFKDRVKSYLLLNICFVISQCNSKVICENSVFLPWCRSYVYTWWP